MEILKDDIFDESIFTTINSNAEKLAQKLEAEVIFFSGFLLPAFIRDFRDFIEEVRQKNEKHKTIAIILRTNGGSPEVAEQMVTLLRKHYKGVYFIVPDFAMSAGTILCMSGDAIYMDYASSLGPVDPQVPSRESGHYLPAMGSLDKVEELTKKQNLTQADALLLQRIDLGELAAYEQAKNLSIHLLRTWLVKYKFTKWTHHQKTRPGAPVSKRQKSFRAKKIAKELADHKIWFSHGRNLDIHKFA